MAEIAGENDPGGEKRCTSVPLGCDVVPIKEEVSGGCVCCTVRRDVEDALAEEALNPNPAFDLVVVDSLATSDPMPVIATMFEEHANEVVTPEVSHPNEGKGANTSHLPCAHSLARFG